MKNLTLVVLFVVICIGVVVVVHFRHPEEPAVTSSEGGESTQVEVPETHLNVVMHPIQDRAESAVTHLFLSQHCPELLDDTVWKDKECLDSIESYFLDSAAYTLMYVGMTPSDAPFTFRMMIDSYESDRELIIDALSRAECRLLTGPIRTDLREQCHADAFFRYLHLTNLCHDAQSEYKREYFATNKYNTSSYKRDLYTLESRYIREQNDQSLYFAERNLMRKDALRDVWLVSREKCPPEVSLASLFPTGGDFPREDLSTVWNAGASDEKKNPPQTEIAARLGFEWLIVGNRIDYNQHLFWRVGNSFESSKQQLYPWLTTLRRAVSSSRRNRTDAIFSAVQGLVELASSGYETDVQGLVERVCEITPKHIERSIDDCATAIANVESMFDATAMKELRMLDSIEEEALALGVYQR